MNVFTMLPILAGVFVAIFVGIAIFFIARAVSQVCPGIVMGHIEILGEYGGGKYFNRVKGLMVDATASFMTRELEPEVKEHLCYLVDAVAKKGGFSPDKLMELENWKTVLNNTKLSGLVNMIVTRDNGKEIIVQLPDREGNLRSMLEYVRHDPKSKLTLQGAVSKGIVPGMIATYKAKWEIPNLGKCTVHLFVPDPPRQDPILPVAPDPPMTEAELVKQAKPIGSSLVVSTESVPGVQRKRTPGAPSVNS
jgi:hypothetical protein